ncbi:cysteine-tryptophan domain-containing zinc finger protein 3-like isoform X1 [Tripterygium wilfordii]|uniref:cysteine-tryptophan domain-containing zinc finger protein 3-like isoform X1 n=1 Tax=Tripterygium wilfordii TaxID=458696 RepID=UPI0018F8179B|nr:cysteine-tryptophan domain-containing zinc finger protein 3-like isoform X1 [Tripterygium wilfordii]XP_038723974.1 cysteine-tryptophan domain-containing zinc finger protein 3-like isoform X1 [Tripterygium wilfordii]XP_038723976.1 cysteine-tryptophan domain-containing zinc finger protein 3-like isoform X1 [Tripterygium wilfordii]
MDENPEVEEGEACYDKKDDDDKIIDPDVALAYIDEKIQNVLGHFQKDFEGGVSAENLGAKFGGYGSFLPSYERPPSIWSHPKTPQRDLSTPRSPGNLPLEGASQTPKAPASEPQSSMNQTVSCSIHALQTGFPSGDASVKQDLCMHSSKVAQKTTTKDEDSDGLFNPTKKSSLKVRLKVGYDNMAWKILYNNLGLDNSPSSSLRSSPEDIGGVLPLPEEITDESPASILQAMTSSPVPGGVLLSPLHDSLFSAVRNKGLSRDGKHKLSLKGSQEYSALSLGGSVATLSNGKQFKEKKAKLVGRSETPVELKHRDRLGSGEDDTASLKGKLENEDTLDKEIPYKGLKREPLFNLVDFGGSVKTAGKASESSGGAYKDVMRDKLLSSAVVKEHSAESISTSREDHGQCSKRNFQNRSVEKSPEHRMVNLRKDVSVDLRDGAKCMGNNTFSHFKASTNSSKYKDRLEVGSTSPPTQKVGQKARFFAQDEISLPCMKSKPLPSMKSKALLEGTKKTVIPSNRKPAAVSTKEITDTDEGVAPKHTMNTAYKIKMLKLNNPKNINKVKDTFKIFPYMKLEQMNYQTGSLERCSGDKSNDSGTGDLEIAQSSCLLTPKRKFDGKRVVDRPISRESIKDAPKIVPHIAESEHASEAVPSPAKPADLKDDWVCCDNCGKWRLIPYGINLEQLPEKWMCSMQDWLGPGMNRCDISEDETTKAVSALYQLPVPESQTNMEHQANGTSIGIPLVNAQCLDQSKQRLKNHVVTIGGKKKDVPRHAERIESSLKWKSKSAKNHLREPVKSISLKDMNQPHAESNVMKKSSYHNLSQSQNLIAEKRISKLEDIRTNGAGKAKQVMMQTRGESDHYGHGTIKKIKIENRSRAGENQNLKIDHGRLGLNSSTGLPAKSGRKNVQKHNQYFDIEELKCDVKDRLLGSVKKSGGQAQVFMDGGSVNMKTHNELDLSVKKRKLKEWQDSYNNVQKSEIYAKEESSESGYRKVKKFKVLNTTRKESGESKKGKVMQILAKGSQGKPADGTVEGVGSMNKSQQPYNKRRKQVSEQILAGVDSMRRDFRPEQVSVAATSSSSKVSGSHKTRAIFEEVKGSPVESVSSSPLRTSHVKKTTSAQLDNVVKNEAIKCGLHAVREFKRCLNGEGNAENNGSAITRKDRLDYQVGDINCKISGIARLPSDLHSGDTDVLEHCPFPGDLQPGYDEERVENHTKVTFSWKSGKGNAVLSKDGQSPTSDFERDEIKIFNSPKIQGDFSFNKSNKYESEDHHQPFHETNNDVKNNNSDKSSIKCSREEKHEASIRDFVGQFSIHSRLKENRLNPEGQDDSDKKLDAICSTNGVNDLQHAIQEFEDESKGDLRHLGPRNALSKSGSLYEDGSKQETQWNRPDPKLQLGGLVEGYPVSASDDGDTSKALNHRTNSGTKNETRHSLGHSIPDSRRVRDSNGSGHGRMISSSQAANNALKKAQYSRDCADRLKSSGFPFESNEAYFQAALEFLQGAFLLETCNSESGKHGGMTQVQVYCTTAKLFEFCAREYERRQEMAFAALAYKCMEVAYMRVVYCKHSSMSGVQSELQATLQMAPQGESPSSSASDLDNLNNQPTTVDKATPSKGAVPHVAGTHVIVARSRPNFVRMLDFTQDVNFAIEASIKSENAFKEANLTLEMAKNRVCITSIKKVVDFSFQDVEGLIHLVQLAREAISRSGFGGAGE